MTYRYTATCISRTGKVRNDNEDNFLFDSKILPCENNGLPEALTMQADTEKRQIFAVFDGMGGELGGEIAARTAAETLRCEAKRFENGMGHLKKTLVSIVNAMSRAVFQKAQELKVPRIGTTVALLTFEQDCFHICNIGDSRIARLSEDEVEWLSEDDVVYNPKLKNQHLTQFVGLDPDQYALDAHVKRGKICNGDFFLLCTDGLYNAVSEQEICQLIRKYKRDLKRCAEKLADLAERNGGDDNYTLMLFRFKRCYAIANVKNLLK